MGASATLAGAVTAAFVMAVPLMTFAAEQTQRLYTVPVEPAPTPKPWRDFCKYNPGDCRADTSGRSLVTLTGKAWDELVTINGRVNASIKPKPDEEHWHEKDKWTYPDDGYGDCEDYALLKRRLLTEAGWPAGALKLTVVWTQQQKGHAVLLVRTDKGGLVLDSNASSIMHWTDTGYRYVKRQRPGNPNEWVYIDGDSPTAKPVPSVAAQGPIQPAPQPKRSPATAVGINGVMWPG